MRVFLDTNVLVSAFATRGLCSDVLRQVLAEHTLVVAEVVLVEFERVLSDRFELPPATIKNILNHLRDQETVPRPKTRPPIDIRDEDDVWVLASALSGNVDVLVTGDKDLLACAGKLDLPITNPRGFWTMLTGEEDP